LTKKNESVIFKASLTGLVLKYDAWSLHLWRGECDEHKSRKKLGSHKGRTRKIVNYACSDCIRGKPWWRILTMLMFNSLVRNGYRGERPIELFSSWFRTKFLAGK